MTRALLVLVAVLVAFLGGVSFAGCREEPTIVIKFEPNDLAGAKAVAVDLGRPAASDLGARPTDLGVAKKSASSAKNKNPECKVAADCVVEPIECCDCANGGKQHAISKKQAAATKSARADKCKHAVCTMMLSTDPSCGERADCVDGACVMRKK
jgi:hypothetical protein